MHQFFDFMNNCSFQNFQQNFSYKIAKTLKVQISTFYQITFDSFQVHEYTIPKNKRLNQTNLAYVIALFSKSTGSRLKMGFYESQILGIPLYDCSCALILSDTDTIPLSSHHQSLHHKVLMYTKQESLDIFTFLIKIGGFTMVTIQKGFQYDTSI